MSGLPPGMSQHPTSLGSERRGNSDADGDPRGPRIIGHEILTGPARVDVRRITYAEGEEAAREVDVEIVSDGFPPRPSRRYETDVYSCTSEEEMARAQPGPSRPLKRARGRPRKDGTGPFRVLTPTIAETIDKAFEGEVILLRPADLAPLADRARIRRGEPIEVRGRDSDESHGSEPSVQWRNLVLDRLDGGDTKDIAAVALEALERVDKAREKNKRSLKGQVLFDLRIDAKVARQVSGFVPAHLAVRRRPGRVRGPG